MTPARSIVLVAAAITVLWFALLGGRALYEPDEGRYAEIPREMLGGDWIVPHLNGLAYLEKPPLQYWITAFIYGVLGESEATARLCTGLAGYLSLATVFFVGMRLWGLRAAFRAALYVLGSALFVLLGHQLTLDMTLSLFLLLTLSCFLMAQAERRDSKLCDRWMLASWVAMALAVLTKGLIGVVIPGVTLCVYLAWQRDTQVLKSLNFRLGAPIFLLVAAPWFVLAARANPAFLKYFFIREHFQRFLTPIEHRSAPWWFFLPVLGIGILPWLPQALCALAAPWRAREPRGSFDARLVLWIWCVFVWAFFSCSDAKLIPYVLPMVPPLAILCAAPTELAARKVLAAGGVLSMFAAMAVLAYLSGRWTSPPALPLELNLRPVIAWTAALYALSGAACLIFAKRSQTALAIICLGWFLANCTVLLAAREVQDFFSAKDVALSLAADAGREASVYAVPVYAVQTFDQSLPFYLQHPVVLVDYRDEFTLGLSQAPERGIATVSAFSSRWRASSTGYAVMPYETYDRLTGQGVPMRDVAHFREQILVSRQ